MKTQIWTAVSVYVLAAIIKKELALDVSLYTFLQILSVHSFEKIQLSRAFQELVGNNSSLLRNGGKTQGDQRERSLARISSGKGGMSWQPGTFSRAPR